MTTAMLVYYYKESLLLSLSNCSILLSIFLFLSELDPRGSLPAIENLNIEYSIDEDPYSDDEE